MLKGTIRKLLYYAKQTFIETFRIRKQVEAEKEETEGMSEEKLMCPICGGLHPAGHRDKELKDKLEAIKNWFNDWIDPWLDKAGEEGFMLPKKRMVSLKKILETEG